MRMLVEFRPIKLDANGKEIATKGVRVISKYEVNSTKPTKGFLIYLGEIDNYNTYRFDKSENGILYLLENTDTEIVCGAEMVDGHGCSVNIVALGDLAILRTPGTRNAHIYKEGKVAEIHLYRLIELSLLPGMVSDMMHPSVGEVDPEIVTTVEKLNLEYR